jgi:hypothetical protein
VGVCVGVRDSGMDAELSKIEEFEKEVELLGKEGEIETAEDLPVEFKGESERDSGRE